MDMDGEGRKGQEKEKGDEDESCEGQTDTLSLHTETRLIKTEAVPLLSTLDVLPLPSEFPLSGQSWQALFSVLVWTVSSVELQSIAEKVNLLQKQWKAETNERFSQMSREEKAALLGVRTIELPVRGRLNPSPTRHFNVSIPETFDAREHWADCASLKRIRDQSKCGSCWAFAAVETLSDRLCIYSKGDIQVTLSADDLLSCCGDACGYGCEGGYPLDAWEYFVKTGVVTGGAYDSNLGCRPYPFPPCSGANYSHYQSCKDNGVFDTPKCEKKCESSYTTSYDNDKFYSVSAYGVKADEESIQKEIISRGPVEVAFDVYEDFYDYKSGVYQYTTGDFVGGHAVKMIGWGVEDGVKYWLIANSWDTVWGEKGFFKIIRGVNELGIEGGVVGGEPKIPAKKSEKEPH